MVTKEQEFFIINQFMGVTYEAGKPHVVKEIGTKEVHVQMGEEEYDTNYNRIMPVIDKLESISLCRILSFQYQTWVKSQLRKEFINIDNGKGGRCYGLYQAALLLIREYNTQKQKEE